MEEELTIEARGSVTWSAEQYVVEAGRLTVEIQSRNGSERARTTEWVLLWRRESEPEVTLGLRPICKVLESREERDTFILQLAPGARLTPLEPPETGARTHPLAEIVGEVLIQVWFVSDSVQLHFQSAGAEPVPAHRSPLTCETPPLLRRADEVRLRHGQPGYADELVGLIGERVAAVDEYLDEGLVVEFANGVVLSTPLSESGNWYEAVTFRTPHYLRVWVAGEGPYRPKDRAAAGSA